MVLCNSISILHWCVWVCAACVCVCPRAAIEVLLIVCLQVDKLRVLTAMCVAHTVKTCPTSPRRVLMVRMCELQLSWR